jgi:hypothetical protein|tara:strand:- start:169 stop:465 length:297 start_codon:yes stop_codon:yes gene_type:complete
MENFERRLDELEKKMVKNITKLVKGSKIKKCNDNNPKTHYVSYTLYQIKFVAKVCDQCFKETQEDSDMETISKESFESFKLEILREQEKFDNARKRQS